MKQKELKKKVKKAPKTSKAQNQDFILQKAQPIEDIEVDDMDKLMEDKMIEDMAQISIKKIIPMKEKQRKVQEFKFRVLDLVSILVEKTSTPEKFIDILPTLSNIVQKLQKDKLQQNYLQRVVKILMSYTNKSKTFQIEQLEQFQTCIDHIQFSIVRCENRGLNTLFCQLYDLLLKVVSGFGKAGKKLVHASIIELVKEYSYKKQNQIQEQFLKKVLANHPNTAFIIFKNICESLKFDSNLKERKRPELILILQFIMKNPKLICQVFNEKHREESSSLLTETTFNIFDNLINQKIKKVGLFRRLMITIQNTQKYAQTQSFEFGQEIKQKLSELKFEEKALQDAVNHFQKQF